MGDAGSYISCGGGVPIKHMEINKVFSSFWVFGLVNNVLYVLILSAAVDLVGSTVPKGVVLLADVLPSFVVKLSAPFYMHLFPYKYRIYTLVVLSFFGMILVAHATPLSLRLFGTVLASMSSGLGEITFLQLTHYYQHVAINGFSSGTGAAGLVGSFVFLMFTTWFKFDPRSVLLIFSIAPFSFLYVYFRLLPSFTYAPILQEDLEVNSKWTLEMMLTSSRKTLRRIKPLVVPYIVPLTTVYIGEYIINQGISPTLLFELDDMPFSTYRDAYVTYGTLYQVGVFISRSSAPFYRIYNLYAPAILQTINVAICVLQSMYMIVPSIYPLFLLMIYEGLLGGFAYVNTYMLVSEQVSVSEREFSMGTVGMSDSAGIVVAALVSLYLEPSLCSYQLRTGRPWCRY